MLAAQATGRLPASAERALQKIAAILPAPARAEVERMSEMIEFRTHRPRYDLDDPRLLALQRAIAERKVVSLHYHSYSRDEERRREVEPLHLQYAAGAWYLHAFCRLRRDVRAFRLERMEDLQVLAEQFAQRQASASPVQVVEVRVRFARRVVRWVREWQHQGFTGEEAPAADGSVVMRYAVPQPREMLPWLLTWGAAATALAPPELRRAAREEAARLVEQLTDQEAEQLT